MRTAKTKGVETVKDLGIIGSAIIVCSWIAKQFFSVEIPAEIQIHAGVLLMVLGGSIARVIRARLRYGK